MPRIYITEPNHFYTFELPTVPGDEVLIGTGPQCRLALPGVAGMGEVHACISCRPQGYVIADLGSPTGTFANGAPIRSEFLQPGVEYRMGAAVITLAVEGMPPQQPPMGMPQQSPMGMPPQQQPPMGTPPQQAPQAAPAAQQAPAAKAAAPATATAKKKSTVSKAKAPAGKGGRKADLASMAARFDRSRGQAASKFTFIYVVIMLAIAFYAGIALHHWERTGNCLPGLVADEQDEPAVAPAKPAAPAAQEADTAEDTSADSTDEPAADEPTDTTTDEPAADEPADTTADEPAADDAAGADDDAPEPAAAQEDEQPATGDDEA